MIKEFEKLLQLTFFNLNFFVVVVVTVNSAVAAILITAFVFLPFKIWDRNVFCDSFLGQAKMTIDINNRTVVLSHQLMGRRRQHNENMPGAVTLEIACYHDLLAVQSRRLSGAVILIILNKGSLHTGLKLNLRPLIRQPSVWLVDAAFGLCVMFSILTKKNATHYMHSRL